MTVLQREILLLLIVFVAIFYFIVTHVVSDLPDDFLTRARQKLDHEKERRRGRIRDNG